MDNLFIAFVAFVSICMLVTTLSEHNKRRREKWKADEIDLRRAFNIAGINKHGADSSCCGLYQGWVETEPENPYDPHAVAVWVKPSTHVGYLSRAIAADLFEEIEALGGKVPCVTQIERQYDDRREDHYYTGHVQILWPDTESSL